MTYDGCMDRMCFKDAFGDLRGFSTNLAKRGKKIAHIECEQGDRIHLYFHPSERKKDAGGLPGEPLFPCCGVQRPADSQ